MTETERYDVYVSQRGTNWTPKQITRHRKKVNQNRRRTYKGALLLRSNGMKSGYTNYDMRNSPKPKGK